MEQNILELPYVSVIYVEEMKLGKIIWHGNPSREEYKKPFLTLVDWAKKGHEVTRFLSDTRNQGVVSPENRKWFETEMVPSAISVGLKRAAVLTDSNVFKMYYLNMILSALNKFNMPFKIFNEETKAIEFLMSES
ncbi:STAS/SEC14 domain-containing protein [Cytophagales bacterium LB-30]|uniref:STAS/SEC14 domain-containing protein n=1 Tax=Shiella aurantiaca TaxID=3058365 RepID=A0ABT8F1N2_9BACT|nr:STAS/SEC14 domain-containing protein [Shiella aurantiaca]MDN4164362.1 STAS/SEC14 domain-containing protein [Shiella aurantiaca]